MDLSQIVELLFAGGSKVAVYFDTETALMIEKFPYFKFLSGNDCKIQIYLKQMHNKEQILVTIFQYKNNGFWSELGSVPQDWDFIQWLNELVNKDSTKIHRLEFNSGQILHKDLSNMDKFSKKTQNKTNEVIDIMSNLI